MITYSNDPTIRFDHTPVINKVGFKVNQVGPDDPYVFPEVDYDDTDSNTIYVNSESPGDDSNPGTYSSPKQTLLAAINATTSTKTKVVVQDTVTIFNEDISGGTFTYLQGIYQESTGGTSSWVARQLGFTPSDSNAVFVAKTGSDSTGTAGTQADPWLTINAAILDCDTGRDVVVIMDSGTYEEEGFEFTGNFTGLYAAIGETPIITPLYNDDLFVEVTTYVTEKTAFTPATSTVMHYGMGCVGNNAYFLLSDSVGGTSANLIMNARDISTGNAYLANTNVWTAVLEGAAILSEDKTEFLIASVPYDSVYRAIYYKKINLAGADTLAPVLIYTAPSHTVRDIGVCKTSLGIVVTWQFVGDSGLYYKIINEDTGAEIKAAAKVYTATSRRLLKSIALADDTVIIPLSEEVHFDLWIMSFDPSDGSVIVSEKEISTAKNFYFTVPVLLDDESIVIIGRDTDDHFYHRIDSVSLTVKAVARLVYTRGAGTSTYSMAALCEDHSLIVTAGAGSTWGYVVVYPHYSFMKGSVAYTINGVSFNATDGDITTTRFIQSTVDDSIKWSLFYELTAPGTFEASYFLKTTGDIINNNTIVRDCSSGISAVSNIVNISDSQFYRIADGYATYINGAAGTGAGINIEHCDFFDCYGGVHLENNDGGEDIKNCIFHDCSVLAIDAEIALTITYCDVTSSVTTTVTLGSYVNRGNPDYVNEGYTDPDDTDLNLRVKVLGYPGNSAAYALADDSRNAGAIDVKYIGTETTYTSITVPKPNQMKHEYVYAGATNTQRKDGSWTSFKDGQSEVLTMTWDGITAAYMTQLITMWKSSEYVVLIYPDPVTYPNSFEQWTLIRESLNNSVGTPTLSDLGAQSVTLKFAKAA